MSLKISQMTAATSATIADLLAIVQGGANKKATIDQVIGTVGADVASASTTNLTGSGISVTITGSTTINGFTSMAAGTLRIVTFSSSISLIHNSTSFILPGEANINVSSKSVGIFVSLGSGNWKCLVFAPNWVTLLAASSTEMEAETSSLVAVTPLVAKYAPSAVKASCFWDMTGTPSIYSSYNVSGITDVGTGNQRVNFTTAFSSSTNMVVTGMTGTFTLQFESTLNAGYVWVTARNSAGTLVDSAFCAVHATGDF